MTAEAEVKTKEQFEEDPDPAEQRDPSELLLLDLDGFDGPIDMLLTLARDQKVDLAKISILALANQYLDFIEKARELRLELAADYLVMAAWLAYLKSRLLIPPEECEEDEPSGEMMAEALAFQLRRLEAMRNAAEELFLRPQLGVDFFRRGAPEGLRTKQKAIHEANLFDLLSAYGAIRRRIEYSTYTIEPHKLMSSEDAMQRLTTMLGGIPADWLTLTSFLPPELRDGVRETLVARSAMASTFGASLELAKRGELQIRQEELFGPIYIRKPPKKRD